MPRQVSLELTRNIGIMAHIDAGNLSTLWKLLAIIFHLKEKDEIILPYVLFTMIVIPLCQYHQKNKSLCVLSVIMGEMSLLSYKNI